MDKAKLLKGMLGLAVPVLSLVTTAISNKIADDKLAEAVQKEVSKQLESK